MDLMIDFVRDRTEELQRVAADLRLAREPHADEPATISAAVAPPRRVEKASSAPACGECVRPSASARPAA